MQIKSRHQMAGEDNRGRESSTQPTIPPPNPSQGTILTIASTTDRQVSIKGTSHSTSRWSSTGTIIPTVTNLHPNQYPTWP